MKTIWTHIKRRAIKGPYVTISDLEESDKVRFIACAGGKCPPTLVELSRGEVADLHRQLGRYLNRDA